MRYTYTNRAGGVYIAPLLQVPPASRGEPRTGSVPPASRGNLKEGGFNRACFCKLCPRDWYNFRTYAVEYGDSWATASNSSRKAMSNSVSPKLDANADTAP